MNLITILDIIKDSSVTKTIWKQELKSTEDLPTLRALLTAYVDVATECMNVEIEYKDFYNKVLNRLEETIQFDKHFIF